MRNWFFWSCTCVLALAACSDEGTGAAPVGAAGTTAGAAGVLAPTAGSLAPPTAGTPPIGSAGSGAASAAVSGTGAPRPSAGTGATATAGTTALPVAGAAPPVAGAAGAAPPVAGTGGVGPDVAVATEPVIPEVAGECPQFTSGTKTIMGLGGISMTAGAKKEGTGALLFYWHGTGSTAGEVNSMVPAAARTEITGEGGVIVSFGRSLGSGGDCSGTGTFSLDDFKIVDLITACAVKNHGINPKRIYTTGCSAGGLMAGCMGIQRSSYLAATAPNSGGITIGYGMLQDPTRMPAVMTMHGSAADNVIVAFAETSEAYDNYMMEKGSFVVNCDHGGGHCAAPSALQASAWQFMKDHPFGTKPSPYVMGLPSGFHSSCKVWTPTMRRPLGEGGGRM